MRLLQSTARLEGLRREEACDVCRSQASELDLVRSPHHFASRLWLNGEPGKEQALKNQRIASCWNGLDGFGGKMKKLTRKKQATDPQSFLGPHWLGVSEHVHQPPNPPSQLLHMLE